MPKMNIERKCTDHELREFLKSVVYVDFCSIMEMRMEAIKDDLCNATSMEQVSKLQGELRGVEFWSKFPEELAKAILEEREDATETDTE